MESTYCFEVEIHRTEGRGHKTSIWAKSYADALAAAVKEYGVGKNGVGCRLRIVQLDGGNKHY